MTILADAPGIRALTDDDLAALYAGAPDETRDAIVAELGRRDRLEQARRKRADVSAEWTDAAHAQYLAAERECCGNLVNRRGVALGITDWSLWSGPESRALAYATEELRNYWDANPRVTVSDYRDQIAAGRRIQRDEIDRAQYAARQEDKMIGEVARGAVHVAERAGMDAARAAARARVTERAAQIRQQAGTVAVRERGAVARTAAKSPEIIAESWRYAERVLTRHVEWPSQAALDTALLWAIHAHGRHDEGGLIWAATPRLLLTSSERGSGKSTALRLLSPLTGSRFGVTPKITAPAFAKVMGKFHEPVFIDEARMVFGTGQKSQELQAMLLAGYAPDGFSLTAHAGASQPDDLFGVVGLAGKDNLITGAGDSVQDLLDRCLVIRLRRASRHHPDIDDPARKAAALAAQGFSAWSSSMRADLIAASSRLSEEACSLPDEDVTAIDAGILRATQIWRPLLAVADVMGASEISEADEERMGWMRDMPARARAACEELTLGTEADDFLASLHTADGIWDDALAGEEAQPW